MNTSTHISTPTTSLVMGWWIKQKFSMNSLSLPSWISLHDMTKLVRGEKHFILLRGEQMSVPHTEMDLKYKIAEHTSAIACVIWVPRQRHLKLLKMVVTITMLSIG